MSANAFSLQSLIRTEAAAITFAAGYFVPKMRSPASPRPGRM